MNTKNYAKVTLRKGKTGVVISGVVVPEFETHGIMHPMCFKIIGTTTPEFGAIKRKMLMILKISNLKVKEHLTGAMTSQKSPLS